MASRAQLERLTKRVAKRNGIDPEIFARQIKQESGFNPHAHSPAGAQGIAQFIPSTAKAYHVNVNDPRSSLEGAARYMKANLNKYGSYTRALSAYNSGRPDGYKSIAETSNYVKTILNGVKDRRAGGSGRAASAARTITGPDPNARRAALQNYLNFSHDPDALLTLARSLENATKTRTVTSPRPGVRNAVGNAVGGKTHIASGADRPGVHTAHSVRQFVRMVSAQAGTPLTIGTGTNHSKMTVDGNVSDHWSGHAADIPATGAKLIRLGRAALIAAGMSPGKARKQTGGLFNVNGHQIIFNTHIGGDHTNHLHVSAR